MLYISVVTYINTDAAQCSVLYSSCPSLLKSSYPKDQGPFTTYAINLTPFAGKMERSGYDANGVAF